MTIKIFIKYKNYYYKIYTTVYIKHDICIYKIKFIKINVIYNLMLHHFIKINHIYYLDLYTINNIYILELYQNQNYAQKHSS